MTIRALVIVLSYAWALLGEAPVDHRETCPDCAGKRDLPCSRCGGVGKADGPCPVCSGKGGKPCTLCDAKGSLKCENCGGQGFKVKYGAGVGGGKLTVLCPPRLPCPKCNTTGLQPCAKCKSTGQILDKCPLCKGKGREKCLRCNGEGKLGQLEPILVPESDSILPGAEAEAMLARLVSALGSLDESTGRIEDLKTRLDELTGLFEMVKTRAAAAVGAAKGQAAFQVDADSCKAKWKLCEASREECASLLKKLAELRAAAEDAAPRLRDRIRNLHGASPPVSINPDEPRPFQAQAGTYSAAVDETEDGLRKLARRLQVCEKETAALDSRLREHEETTQKKRLQGEAQSAVFQNVLALLPTIQKRAGLPELEGKLLPSKSALDLDVQLSSFDDDAAEAAGAGEPEPTPSLLEKIPAVVSQVFESAPEVVMVHLHVDATFLTDTGLEERRTMQSFTMDRPRWSDLTRGHFKNDWRLLLEKSKPLPAFPRRAGGVPEGTWAIAALIGFCFLGLAVVYIARSRMMS